jgi:hypothetical protein
MLLVQLALIIPFWKTVLPQMEMGNKCPMHPIIEILGGRSSKSLQELNRIPFLLFLSLQHFSNFNFILEIEKSSTSS